MNESHGKQSVKVFPVDFFVVDIVVPRNTHATQIVTKYTRYRPAHACCKFE